MMVLIIILLIVLLVVRKKKSLSVSDDSESAEIETINKEILAELDKANPNFERVKVLRERMNRLSNGGDGGYSKLTRGKKATKGKRGSNGEVSGIEIALYVGSLLILAGVGGLVWTGLDELGLGFLVLSTIAFYVGGILLRKHKQLGKVGQAFVGTGMVMLPFIGILFYNVTKADPRIIWLVLSLIGIPVYLYAAYIMNNRVFAFLTIAGLVSLSCSVSATMGLNMVWYFALVMGLGIVLDLVGIIGLPRKLEVMHQAVRVTGQWLPLATFIASLLAIYSIKEIDYVILLVVMIVQFGINLWQYCSLVWEYCLRIAVFAFIVMLLHVIIPSNITIGIGLIIGAVGELLISYYMLNSTDDKGSNRWALEAGWVIVALVCCPTASMLITGFSSPQLWVGLIIALIADIVITVMAKLRYKLYWWYYAMIPIGVVLPIAVVQLFGIANDASKILLVASYILSMFIMEALGWNEKSSEGDAMLVTGLIVFGIASFTAKPTPLAAAVTLGFITVALYIRGHLQRRERLQESAIYTGAATLIQLINATVPSYLDWSIPITVNSHIVFGSLITASLLWDTERKSRMVFGSILHLLIMGILALSGKEWVMVLFMAEAIGVLLYGIVSNFTALWVSGAVALFGAAMWFTRGLSFVWPVVLGLSLIGGVVVIILRNNKK